MDYFCILPSANFYRYAVLSACTSCLAYLALKSITPLWVWKLRGATTFLSFIRKSYAEFKEWVENILF